MRSMSERFLLDANNELIKNIGEYESDTFSSQHVKLTDDEAFELAGRAILWFVNNRLDGCMLSEWLDEIR